MSAPVGWVLGVPAGALADAYEERPGQAVLVTQMDRGLAKRRRHSTAVADELDVTLSLTPTECDTLMFWWRHTLKHGALPFIFRHPRRHVDVICRMRGEAVPQVASAPGMRGTRWHVQLELEVLP